MVWSNTNGMVLIEFEFGLYITWFLVRMRKWQRIIVESV